MIDVPLLIAVLSGIVILLLLILKLRLQAFISLLIASISVGLIAGMAPASIIDTIKEGMGGTLGFVATVVGLGAMFGAILEHSGGAQAIAGKLIRLFGEKNAPTSMLLAGFLVAIPVFFDVAFIILIPVIYALQRKTGQSLLLYAIPLLAGLAITHGFIPPTPGPIAVADIIGAELGWVILAGLLVGIPVAVVSGLWFGRYIAARIFVAAPDVVAAASRENDELPGAGTILAIIGIPIFLILLNTLLGSPLAPQTAVPTEVTKVIELIGHPFVALIIANLIAWWLLGIRRGTSREQLFKICTKSMEPAGVIILLTGAGGVFKQVLINTGAGEMLATAMSSMGIPVLVFGYIAAVLIRVIQGSATVAMITAAGMAAPLLAGTAMSGFDLALIVIAIAAGATTLSHVNDSGFWLVSQYLGLSERDTFRSWTVMTSLLSISGFLAALLLFLFL